MKCILVHNENFSREKVFFERHNFVFNYALLVIGLKKREESSTYQKKKNILYRNNFTSFLDIFAICASFRENFLKKTGEQRPTPE